MLAVEQETDIGHADRPRTGNAHPSAAAISMYATTFTMAYSKIGFWQTKSRKNVVNVEAPSMLCYTSPCVLYRNGVYDLLICVRRTLFYAPICAFPISYQATDIFVSWSTWDSHDQLGKSTQMNGFWHASQGSQMPLVHVWECADNWRQAQHQKSLCLYRFSIQSDQFQWIAQSQHWFCNFWTALYLRFTKKFFAVHRKHCFSKTFRMQVT